MPGLQGVIDDFFLLGATCTSSFGLRPNEPTGCFRCSGQEDCSAPEFYDSRQARVQTVLPGGAEVIPSGNPLSTPGFGKK
jgi:hypothetical protein